MAHSIGIDFGTTKTLVSYYNLKTGNPGYVRLGRDIDKMPTTIAIAEDGTWLYGDDAEDFMAVSSSRGCRDFKLKLGKSTPCLVVKAGGKIQKFTAKDLVVRFVRNIKERCEREVFHESVSSCVVTHPVAFTQALRRELEEAVREAGFDEVSLLAEPIAAGYAFYQYGEDRMRTPLMVVDWGGGTVDFAMIRLEDGVVDVIPDSSDGEKGVGGRKFDEMLFSHLSLKAVQGQMEGSPSLDKQIRTCKEQLSRLSALRQVRLDGENTVFKVDVDRNEFNQVITSVVNCVIDRLKKRLASCSTMPKGLLLIGGSSAIPFIRERLQAETGLSCVEWDKAKEAVSIGAAWWAHKITNKGQTPPNAECAPSPVGATPSPLSAIVKPQWRTGRELEAYIEQQRMDHEDSYYLYRQLLQQFWLLNTTVLGWNSFLEKLGEIKDENNQKEVALRVGQALSVISLCSFDELLEPMKEMLQPFTEADFVGEYLELYPQLKAHLVQKATVSGEMSYYEKALAPEALRSSYEALVTKYNQLMNGYDRYRKIMSKSSGSLKWAVIGALCVVSAPVMIGCACWQGWSALSDNDFVKAYGQALQDFCACYEDFSRKGAELMLAVANETCKGRNEAFSQIEIFLRALNAEGVDLEVVQKRIDNAEIVKILREGGVEALSSYSYVMAAAVEGLQKEAALPPQRMQRVIANLRDSGYPLLSDGSIDEDRIAQLQTQAYSCEDGYDVDVDDVVSRIQETFRKSGCLGLESFYINNGNSVMTGLWEGNAIPAEKLRNALLSYAQAINEEEVLCLFDATFFGSAEEGFILTIDGIFGKSLWSDPYAFAWADMTTVGVADDGLYVNDIKIDTPEGCAENVGLLIRGLNQILLGVA